MDNKQNKQEKNLNNKESKDFIDQKSIMENDYTELNNEISKLVLGQKEKEINSQNEKFYDNDQYYVNLTPNEGKIHEDINNKYSLNNKAKLCKNQENVYQLFNNNIFNNKSFQVNNNVQKDIFNLDEQINENNSNNIFIMNNTFNNNVNNYFGINNLNVNFNIQNPIMMNNKFYYNKYGTPNFNYINNPLSPIIYEQNFYSPLIPFSTNKINNNFNINNPQNKNFCSVNINNLDSNNANDDIILDNMLIKRSKLNKNKKNKLSNNFHFINYNNKNNNNTLRNQLNKKNNQDNEKNKINIHDIILQKDKRTTLMIKNIPNKYTINLFLEEINIDFKDKYDIFYLPIDYENKCNLGFAFINFVESFHIIEFYDLYKGKKWKKFNSEKICDLVYAKYQGKKELINHFEKGKVLLFDNEEKRPLILPTPNPLPLISIPIKYLELFKKYYPFLKYSILNNDIGKEKKFILQKKLFLFN